MNGVAIFVNQKIWIRSLLGTRLFVYTRTRHAYLRRMKGRLGSPKAVTALAHKLASSSLLNQ